MSVDSIVRWFNENYTWFFSGMGVLILTIVWRLIAKASRTKRNKNIVQTGTRPFLSRKRLPVGKKQGYRLSILLQILSNVVRNRVGANSDVFVYLLLPIKEKGQIYLKLAMASDNISPTILNARRIVFRIPAQPQIDDPHNLDKYRLGEDYSGVAGAVYIKQKMITIKNVQDSEEMKKYPFFQRNTDDNFDTMKYKSLLVTNVLRLKEPRLGFDSLGILCIDCSVEGSLCNPDVQELTNLMAKILSVFLG